ncbi:MAG: S41 family peptidase [Candidatus Buchananbacteria bacterium]|nr:S41 family peptidase [Candidatus Buchananbacteria bacterium]
MTENQNQKPKLVKGILVSYAGLIAILLVFILGFAVGKSSLFKNEQKNISGGEITNAEEIPDFLKEDVDFQEFWQVWKYIKENYVQSDVTDTQLFYGAMAGLVGALDDPYSVFFDPEISEKFEEELSGSFEGIGAEIGIKEGQLTVIAPLEGTPAKQAGLSAGDAILAIDGYDTAGIALDYAVSKIRGDKGSEVVLSIYRTGDSEPHDVTIVRDTIEIDSVKLSRKSADGKPEEGFELKDGDIAYIELSYFNENTLADWNKTIQEALAANPKGIVLDLRNNPGGFLQTAIEIAGEWVNGKEVVYERLRDGVKIAHNANRQARLNDFPTVVLVNRGSASGSEIVAGALQDYDEATIIGETTFGKGSVQDLKKFKDGSAVKLTIAEWLTPLERNINKEGIKPDIEVVMTREDYENNRDPQLDRALEFLRNGQ